MNLIFLIQQILKFLDPLLQAIDLPFIIFLNFDKFISGSSIELPIKLPINFFGYLADMGQIDIISISNGILQLPNSMLPFPNISWMFFSKILKMYF